MTIELSKSELTKYLLNQRTHHRQAVVCAVGNDCERQLSCVMGNYAVIIEYSDRYGFKSADGKFFKYATPVQKIELFELKLNNASYCNFDEMKEQESILLN